MRAAPLSLVRSVPAWVWLAGLVAASSVVRWGFGRRLVGPWIMVDELIYAELAKSFAADGTFAIRDVAAGGSYGVVYPLLISPAYALFDSAVDAYAAVKTINGVVISLTAVPVYLLARTVVRPALALLAAAMALAVPSVLYSGTVMTENAFYPVFALAALALVRVLERPDAARVAALLAASGLAFLTRAQGVVLLPAIALAPLVLAVLERRSDVLRRFALLYGTLAAGALVVAAAQAARGRSPLDLLGAYAGTSSARYDATEIARWLLWHVAELDIYVGVVPFAALLVLALAPSRLRPADRRFVAAAVALTASLLPVVAAFASRYALRVEERNAFYLAPLFFVALLVWIERGCPRPAAATAVAAAAAAALPALLPFERLVNVTAQSDTLALLAWWRVHDAGVALGTLWVVAVAGAAALTVIALVVPPRLALVLPFAVLALYAVALHPIEAGAHGVRRASLGAVFEGITAPQRDWIDRAVGRDARVDVVWSGAGNRLVVHVNEFFNRSLRRVFYLRTPTPGALPETPLRVDPSTGLFRTPDGSPVRSPYVLTDRSVDIAGAVRAQDPKRRLVVIRVDNPLRTTQLAEGVYEDTWGGPVVRYTRYRCAGGAVAVRVSGDTNLFARPSTVRALVAGRELARAVVPQATDGVEIVAPLRRAADGNCRVRFLVTPTAVPGPHDRRRLGLHFHSFRYERPS